MPICPYYCHLFAVIRLGFELVSTTSFNAFFVKNELFALFHIEGNDINVMHDVLMPTEFLQLYNDTAKLVGCKKLIWKKHPIADRDVQVLSPAECGFPCLPKDHDVLTRGAAHFGRCKRDQHVDVEFFLQSARDAFQKYTVEVRHT